MENTVRTRKGFSFLSLLLGLLLGVILTVGALGGLIYYLLFRKIDDLVPSNSESGFVNTDVNSGGVETLYDLLGRVISLSDGLSDRTFRELQQTFPVIGDVTKELATSLNQYFEVTKSEIDDLTISTAPDFFMGLTDRVSIVNMISCTPQSNAIIVYLCFGVTSMSKQEPYTARFNDNGIKRDCTVELKEDGTISGVYYTVGEGDEAPKIYMEPLGTGNLQARIDGVMNDVPIGDIVSNVSQSDKILYSVRNSTINSLAEDVNKLSLQQIFTDEIYGTTQPVAPAEGSEESRTPAIIYKAVPAAGFDSAQPISEADFDPQYIYYKKVTEGDAVSYQLANGNGKLTLDQFKGITYSDEGEPLPAQKVDYYSYGKQTDAEGNATYLIGFDPAFLYYTADGDGGYSVYNSAAEGEFDKGRLSALPEEGEYYTYGAPLSMWKIILYLRVPKSEPVGDEEEFDRYEVLYALNGIGGLMDSVRDNMEHSTMYELNDAGLITYTDPSVLDLPLGALFGGATHHTDKLYGECTLKEVIEAFNTAIKNQSSLPGAG